MDVVTYYDMLIDENNDPFRDPPVLREYMDRWDGQPFIDTMKLDGNQNVLEIGVGTGRLAARVAPLCRHFTGIDISPKTIVRAKDNLMGLGNTELICADFLQYAFTCKFDVIYSSLTMMHIKEKRGFIEKAAALLCGGGILSLSLDKNRNGFIKFGNHLLEVYPDSPENTVSIIKDTGLCVLDSFQTEYADIIVSAK